MEMEIHETSEFRAKTTHYEEIPTINSKIDYNEFFNNYLVNNQACLIRNITTDWNSSKFWIKNDLPNFLYLNNAYGDSLVSIINCDQQIGYNQQKPLKWKFREYLQYWQNRIRDNVSNEPTLYLKDWHLKNEYPNDNFYNVPLYFASDWLNEYLVENSLDDYRFVYMGVKGTWSPFHVDVMTSYSWSANIFGKKMWVLFPPGEEKYLYDSLGNLANDITNLKDNRRCFEMIQNPGDAVFVPSNWHHQVWNITDTISINHNWINGCNLHYIWQSMEKNLLEIKNEIDDCRDMENFLDHSQLMLKVSFGFNFKEFFDLMQYIGMKRVRCVQNRGVLRLFNNYLVGNNHVLCDLSSIQYTLKTLIKHNDVEELTCFNNIQYSPEKLLQTIEDTLPV